MEIIPVLARINQRSKAMLLPRRGNEYERKESLVNMQAHSMKTQYAHSMEGLINRAGPA